MKRFVLISVVLFATACQVSDPNITPDQPTEEWMNVRVHLEIQLGGVYYPNIDAPITVNGIDKEGVTQWQQDYTYSGPDENDLKIKTGFDKYSIAFTKWGKTLTQTFTQQDLWVGRVQDNVVPVTKVFQTQIAPKRIIRIVTSFTQKIDDAVTEVPETKMTYSWDSDNKLRGINHYNYDQGAQVFVTAALSELTYENGRVSEVIKYPIGSMDPIELQKFTYDDQGRTTHVQQNDINNGITTDVALSWTQTDRLITASYHSSNGGGFDYEIRSEDGNIKSDKTNRGTELCSEGAYTSDKNVNPLRHLGYIDYLLTNFSSGNRVTENVNYVGCSFPTLVPLSYEYQYDNDGYPLRKVTHYKDTEGISITDYTYDE